MLGFTRHRIDGKRESRTCLSAEKDAFLRRSSRSGITRLREYSFTFLNRLNVPVGVSLCVVVWIRSGIYLLTKEVI